MRRPIATPPGHTDQHDPRIVRSWWTVAGIFVALGLIAGYRLISDAGSLLDWLVLALVVYLNLLLMPDPRLIDALPLLVPFAILASLEIDSLRRMAHNH